MMANISLDPYQIRTPPPVLEAVFKARSTARLLDFPAIDSTIN